MNSFESLLIGREISREKILLLITITITYYGQYVIYSSKPYSDDTTIQADNYNPWCLPHQLDNKKNDD